jgi:23S rRNA (uridine2552-2'-O)-methyltransferase
VKKYSCEIERKESQIVRKKTIVKNKNLKHSSRIWLQKHINDEFVAKAKEDGYSTRAAYKLLEIAKKYRMFHNADVVLDLGAAPGSWTEVLLKDFNVNKVIAVDLLPIKFIDHKLFFLEGDFTDEMIQGKIINLLNDKKISVIISDIAPNTSGDSERDRLSASVILESIINFAEVFLKEDGFLLMKCIKGAEQEIMNELKKGFYQIKFIKPDASRKNSSEIYLLCKKMNEK